MNNFSKRLAGLSLGLLLTLGVGATVGQQKAIGVKAAAPEIAKLEFTGTRSSSDTNATNQYTDTWTETSFTISNFSNNNWGWKTTDSTAYLIKCGRKTNKGIDYPSIASITNTAAFTGVASITISVNDYQSSKGKVNSFYLECGTDSSDITKNKIEKTMSKGDIVFDLGTTEYSYFKITIDCASGSSNGFVAIEKVTYNGVSTDPVVSFDNAPTTAFDVDVETEKAALTYTTKNITTVDSATWSTSDENVVTIDSETGKFKTVGGGTATITLSLTYDGVTEPLTTSAEINVNYDKVFTVDEAYALISSLTTSDATVYSAKVKGKIISIYPAEATTASSFYYYIFNTSDGKELQVFFGAYLTTAPEGFYDVLVGSTVTFLCNLQYFKSKTPELVNPQLVEYDAVIYATYFVNTLKNGACADPIKDNTEALKTAWTDLKEKWAYVDSTSKGDLKDATAEDATYGAFVKLYDHIMKRYGEAKLGEGANFVGRSVASTPSGANAVFAAADNNLTITIIVLVSVISVSLIIGTTLIIRKRKVN